MYSDVVIIIPARIGSTRLPNKPLQIIGNQTIIEHVLTRIKNIKTRGIFVATDSIEIYSLVESNGFKAIMTDKTCKSGTDRVHDAFKALQNQGKIKYVINLQGDMPFIDPIAVTQVIDALRNSNFEIITSVTKVSGDIAASPSNVKVVIGKDNKALYFSRSPIPYGSTEFFYHVGIYGFTAKALEKFVSLTQSINEQLENLEQLRALDNNMSIGVCYSNEIPISIDTPEDLSKARKFERDQSSKAKPL